MTAARTLYVAEPPASYRRLPPAVVDSSIVCALLFDEPARDAALATLGSHSLHTPRLLDYEVTNVAVNKLRARMPEDAVQQALRDYRALPFEHHEVEPEAVWQLAHRYRLSAYDAAYLWLAAELKAPLATFDRRLGEAARAHLGTLE
jgi:predicted nucleic acid-binding protein